MPLFAGLVSTENPIHASAVSLVTTRTIIMVAMTMKDETIAKQDIKKKGYGIIRMNQMGVDM